MKSVSGLSAALLYMASAALAAPSYTYPLSVQFPPLIQYGKPYSYQLPVDTFSSPSGNTTYSAAGLPTWLAFDGGSRTFSGTAPANSGAAQTNDIQFELIGADSSGNTTVNATLKATSIQVATLSDSVSISSVLLDSGKVSTANTLILNPNTDFTFNLSKSLFNSPQNNPITQYFTVTSSHTPLPIWLSFDSNTFTFSGRSPSVKSDIAPSETFSFSLLAIQEPGFSSVAMNFNLQVGPHQFSTNVTSANQTATPNQQFSYALPLDKMMIDGKSIAPANISSISSTSNWLSPNVAAGSIGGTVPSDFESASYVVTVTNTFGDSVKIDLNLSANGTYPSPGHSMQGNNSTATGDVFAKSSLPAVNATAGGFFSYTLPSSAIKPNNATIKSSFQPPAPWLTFNQSNLTFTGQAPTSASDTQVTLVDSNDANDKLEFNIRVVEAPSNSISGSSSSNKTVAIACGIAIPVVVILAIIALFLCCRRRRKTKVTGPISSPILPDQEIKRGGIRANRPADLEHNSGILIGRRYSETSEKVPETPGDVNPFGESCFDSPGRATEINMYKLDNPKTGSAAGFDFQPSPISYFSEGESEATHVDDRKLDGVQRNILGDLERGSGGANSPAFTGTALGSHANMSQPSLSSLKVAPPTIPPRAALRGEERAPSPGTPQNSWRQASQSTKRWHPRAPGGSMAAISPDDIPSIRMVDNETTTTHTSSREATSPILRQLDENLSDYSDHSNSGSAAGQGHQPASQNSNSASIGSYSSSGSDQHQHYGQPVPHAQASNLGAITEAPHFNQQYLTAENSEHDIYNMSRTASSCDSEYLSAESTDDDGDIHPRLNSRGEWVWEKVGTSSEAGVGPAGSPGFDFGPSAPAFSARRDSNDTYVGGDVRTISSSLAGRSSMSTMNNNNNGSSSAGHGNFHPGLNHKASTKLVSFTKERSASVAGSYHGAEYDPKMSNASAAELSFI